MICYWPYGSYETYFSPFKIEYLLEQRFFLQLNWIKPILSAFQFVNWNIHQCQMIGECSMSCNAKNLTVFHSQFFLLSKIGFLDHSCAYSNNKIALKQMEKSKSAYNWNRFSKLNSFGANWIELCASRKIVKNRLHARTQRKSSVWFTIFELIKRSIRREL